MKEVSLVQPQQQQPPKINLKKPFRVVRNAKRISLKKVRNTARLRRRSAHIMQHIFARSEESPNTQQETPHQHPDRKLSMPVVMACSAEESHRRENEFECPFLTSHLKDLTAQSLKSLEEELVPLRSGGGGDFSNFLLQDGCYAPQLLLGQQGQQQQQLPHDLAQKIKNQELLKIADRDQGQCTAPKLTAVPQHNSSVTTPFLAPQNISATLSPQITLREFDDADDSRGLQVPYKWLPTPNNQKIIDYDIYEQDYPQAKSFFIPGLRDNDLGQYQE